MKVSDLMHGINTTQTSGRLSEIRADQVVNVSIKQKLSPTEAVVEINGQEYRAAFETGVPQETKVAAQVAERNEDILRLRTLSAAAGKNGESPSPEVVAERLLRDTGIKVTLEVKEAVRRLIAEKVPLNKEVLRAVERIMQKGEGTVQQKLDVLSIMARKNILISAKSYESVFRVLHGPSLDEILHQLAKEAPDLLPEWQISKQKSSQGDYFNELQGVEGAKTKGQEPPQASSVRTETQASRLSQQLDILHRIIKSEQPVNREQLTRFIEQLKVSPELKKVSQDVQRSVQQIVEQVERAIRETPANQREISPEKIRQTVDRKALEQAVQQTRKEIAQQPRGETARQPRQEMAEDAGARVHEQRIEGEKGQEPPQASSVRTETQASRLSQQLDILHRIIKSEQPVNREQLTRFIEQLKVSPELKKVSQDVQRSVQQIVEQVERAIRETPANQREISPEKIRQTVDRKALEQAVQQTRKEIAQQPRGETARQPRQEMAEDAGARVHEQRIEGEKGQEPPQASSVRTETQASRLSQQLDILHRIIKSEQPVNREQLTRFIEQLKVSPELKKVSQDVQRSVQQIVEQVERAIRETPANQREVSLQKTAQTIDRKLIESIVNQVSKELAIQQQSASKDPELAKITAFGSIQKLAELVLDIRISGKVTRAQITELQKVVQNITEEAKFSPVLQKDIQDLIGRLTKDLRMSLSYEAVGRNAEAKTMVQRSMDTLVQLFKLPISEVIATRNDFLSPEAHLTSENAQENSPQFLRPVNETFMRLGSLVSLARHELMAVFDDAGITDLLGNEGISSRKPETIINDLISSLREAAVREALPREEIRKMEQIMQKLEETTEIAGRMPEQKLNPPVLLEGMIELEQLLVQSSERIAALTNVQTSNFERVTEYIPDYLREVGNEFKQAKKEIINNVERMSQFLQQKVPQASSYVQRIIEPTIEMVNRLVSKGEFALFADMEFEHDILRISGELQNVKNLLDKGEQDKALKMFQQIRVDLEKLHWQPSYMKVERFFSKKTGEGEVLNPFQTYGQQWREESLTGRSVQEWLRGVGLSHERDALEWIVRREEREASFSHIPGRSQNGSGGNNARNNQDSPPQNFKSMLMNGMENVAPRAKEMMEHALSNITGQQLLSKQDPSASIQSMMVQLPLPWEEEAKAVQIHIHSRTNNEQMDWENCNLFFFLDTPKFGEMGISVMIVNRELTIRVQNDHSSIEQDFVPYIPQLKKGLQELGYFVNTVSFAPVMKEAGAEKDEKLPTVDLASARANATRYKSKEGVDFSI